MSVVSVCLDWLRYTVFWNTPELPGRAKNWSASRLASAVSSVGTNWKEAKARNGYTSAVESEEYKHLTVSWNVQRPDMGVSVDMPGSVLQQIDPMSALWFAVTAEAHVSRIDIAVDIPQIWFADDIKKAWKEGEVDCKARKGGIFDGSEGWTFYVGSRASEKYLRIYDKQAQTGGDYPWTRVELECKGDFARGIAKMIKHEGYSIIPAVIKGFCDFPTLPNWVDAMQHKGVFVSLPKAERHSNTRGWLLETVAPVLVRMMIEDPSFVETWSSRIGTLLVSAVGVGEVDIFDGKADFMPQ